MSKTKNKSVATIGSEPAGEPAAESPSPQAQAQPEPQAEERRDEETIMETASMGNTSLIEKIHPGSAPYALHGFGDYEVYVIDFAELDALKAATYDLVQLPVGRAFIGGYVIVLSASDGSETMEFGIDGGMTKTKKISAKAGSVTSLDVGNDGTVVSKLTGDEGSKVQVTTESDYTDLKIVLAVKTVDCTAFDPQLG